MANRYGNLIETNKIRFNFSAYEAEEGFVAVRSDNKVRTLMNATEGISIEQGDGRFLMTQSGKKLLEAFRDSYGGVLKIYDVDSNLNARMGVESGITDSVGGTLRAIQGICCNTRESKWVL